MVSHRSYTYLIGALGLGLLLVFIGVLGLEVKLLTLKHIIFLFFMVISELQTFRVNNSYLSMEFGFVYSAIFIFGPVPAALMKALSTLISQIYFKIKNDSDDTVDKILFNVGQYMVSFFCAIGLYLIINKNFVLDYPLSEIVVQGGAILTYFLINNLLIESYIALKYEKSILENLSKSLILDFSTYLVSVPAGVAIVIIYKNQGFFETLLVLAIYLTVVYVYIVYMNLISTNRELAALYDVAATITSTLDVEKVMDIVLASVQSIAPWDTACLYVYQKGYLIPAIYEGFKNKEPQNIKIDGKKTNGHIICTNKGEIISNCDKEFKLKLLSKYPAGTKSMIIVPMITNKELIGGISLTSKRNNVYTAKHLTLISILASQAAVALNNAELFDKTTQMAVTDGLTGLYNHTYIYSELERQIRNMKNNGGIFSLIIIDVDHFKTYNDIYGHLIGDTILQKLAKILRKNVRDKDTVGRYGGEEFVLILPEAHSVEAVGIAERIRKVVEKTVFATVRNNNIHITISAGIASYPGDAESVDDLVNKADKAMIFGAKQTGRNKVVMFRPNMNINI